MKQDNKKTRQQLIAEWIKLNYVDDQRLKYDIVKDKLQIRQREANWHDLTERDANDIVLDCCELTGANVRPSEVWTVLYSHIVPIENPLRDYVARQQPYDVVAELDWIDMMAQQVTLVDTKRQDLWRACFKKWFVGMVAGWMNDDVVNHQVLVLIGRQGIYKTNWLKALLPPELSNYHTFMHNKQLNKDDLLSLSEFGLINLDEIDTMSPRDLNYFKSVITAPDTNERGAYQRSKQCRVRVASFCASGNKREFLTDITGNRRWLPFEVDHIESPFGRLFPYERLYAQAWHLVQSGFNYWFEQDEISNIADYQENFRAQDNEEQLIPVLFDLPHKHPAGDSHTVFLTTAEIQRYLNNYGDIKRPVSITKLGMLLAKYGFEKGHTHKGNVWRVYQYDGEEIKNMKRVDNKGNDDEKPERGEGVEGLF